MSVQQNTLLDNILLKAHLPVCMLNWHQPDRRRARWDGFNFITTCRSCGSNLRRLERGRWFDKGRWKKEWMVEKEKL